MTLDPNEAARMRHLEEQVAMLDRYVGNSIVRSDYRNVAEIRATLDHWNARAERAEAANAVLLAEVRAWRAWADRPSIANGGRLEAAKKDTDAANAVDTNAKENAR